MPRPPTARCHPRRPRALLTSALLVTALFAVQLVLVAGRAAQASRFAADVFDDPANRHGALPRTGAPPPRPRRQDLILLGAALLRAVLRRS